MRATISKIHPTKYSRNGGAFTRVEFKLEDGSWAKTDLVQSFRNYPRWKNLLKVGNALSGIVLKRVGEVNADSYLQLIDVDKREVWRERPDGSMELIELDNFVNPDNKLEPLDPEPIQPKLL